MRPLSVLSLICLFVASTALAQNFQSHSYAVAAGHLAAADFNHDGYTDLLAYGGGSVKVLPNNKSGGLGTAIMVSSADANEAAIADFNGDGYADVVLCGPTSVRVFLNHSGTSFSQVATLASTHNCNGVVAADVNHDGKADIVIGTAIPDSSGSTSTSQLVTFFGDGAGHFTAPSTQTINVADTTGNYPDCYVSELAGSDFRGTGVNDLLVFTYCENGTVNSGQAFFAKNSGSGQYTLTYLSNVAMDSPNDPPKVVDVNRDGLPDVIMPTWMSGPHGSADFQTDVFINQGGGNFTAKNVFDQSDYAASYLSAVFAAAVADFTGDGKPDIAASFTNSPDGCCTPDRPGVELLSNAGSNTWNQWENIPTSGYGHGIATADFNHDNRWDFAVAQSNRTTGATSLRLFTNTQTYSVSSCKPSGAGVHRCLPASGATYASPVRFLATANGITGPVRLMQLYVDGHKLAQVPGNQLDVRKSLAAGTHSVRVVELEFNGQYSKSAAVSFKVQ